MKTVIQVPMEKELLARLAQRAKAEAVSRAALIRTACVRYLREAETAERVASYVAGYLRIPDETTEEESLAWLAAAEAPDEGWPEEDWKETKDGAR